MFNEEENIEHEAPNLFGLKGKNSFKVPENYFEELEQRITIENTLLDEFKTKEKNDVPKGYFDELPSRIEERIKPKGKIVKLFNIKRFAYAASIAVIATLSLLLLNKGEKINEIEGLLASTTAYEETEITDFFEGMIESDLEMEGIVFEDVNIEEVDTEDYDILEEEIELDPTDLIEFDEEFDLFE